jgi:hypothetical protein
MRTDDIPVLIGQTGFVKGSRWSLTQQEIYIGRDSTCEIIINDKTVSRKHLRIYRANELWMVEDMSKNGTHLNDVLLKSPEVLQDGDVITVSTVAKFAFIGSEATVPLALDAGMGGKLRLDVESRKVWINNIELDPPLSIAQFRLVELLYHNMGRVCSRDEVVAVVWPESAVHGGVSEQSVDALVRRVRDRLAELDSETQYVMTIRGHGFRLDNPL